MPRLATEFEGLPMVDATERHSIVDVFENFFGSPIESQSAQDVSSLSHRQSEELVEAIDAFLEAAAEDEFRAGAVCLESLSNPIIFSDDSNEPRTTRRAKQVALMHREVVIPMQPFWIHEAPDGRYAASLLRWTSQNERLLRAHVLSVMRRQNVVATAGEERVQTVVDWAVAEVSRPEFEEVRRALLGTPGSGRLGDREAIEASIYTALTDAVNSGSAGTSLSFLNEDSCALHRALFSLGEGLAWEGIAMPRNVTLLTNLELPGIADIPDADFVAIRLQSEDFGEFRETLGRVLERTGAELERGDDLEKAFRGNLDEVRWKAELLRKDLADKALPRYLRKTAQLASIGTIVSSSGALAADMAQGAIHPAVLASRAGATLVMAALMSLLQYTSNKRKARLLRFYDVLLRGTT